MKYFLYCKVLLPHSIVVPSSSSLFVIVVVVVGSVCWCSADTIAPRFFISFILFFAALVHFSVRDNNKMYTVGFQYFLLLLRCIDFVIAVVVVVVIIFFFVFIYQMYAVCRCSYARSRVSIFLSIVLLMPSSVCVCVCVCTMYSVNAFNLSLRLYTDFNL